MRRRAVLAASIGLALVTAVAAPLYAENTGNLRIAVLDVERVRRDAAAVKAIRVQLSSYVDAYRIDAQKEEQAIRSAEEELSRKRNFLSGDGYTEERKKLEERLIDAQDRAQNRRQTLERVNAEAMERVKQTLERIVTEIADERQLTLILRKDQVVFVAPAVEITDDVMQRLDQRLPNVQIADPGN